jgi:predicted dehydrogenase
VIGAAVVGTGFIGVVHVEALRRIGVEVVGVVGSSPQRARQKPGLPEPYDSFEAMLDDDRVRVVHLTTPNHLHHPQVNAVLSAGKHVVCEKPLALTSAESSELLRLAEESGLVHCTNYNIRFYPLLHEARQRVLDGDLGRVWNVHGTYSQDWLHQPTDWNWRLDPELGGSLRAVADIGTHWLDLTSWIANRRVAAVFADLYTVHPVRQVPTGPVETYADVGDVERADREMTTEDIAHVLLRYEDGSRGQVTISQVSAGRKNLLSFELDGSEGALAWTSERQEELWLGHRNRPNELLFRDPGLMRGPVHGDYPAGHAEGFDDTFKLLYRAVYAAVEEGRMPAEPNFPTFADGHEEIVLGEAIARSAAEERWVQVER